MEGIAKVKLQPVELRHWKTDFKFCILCQTHKNKEKLRFPQSFEKLLLTIEQRAKWQDEKYTTISKRLSKNTNEELIDYKSGYHKSCYSICTNKISLGRLKRNFEEISKQLQTENLTDTKEKANENYEESSPGPSIVTRSQVTKYDKTKCVFCDRLETRKRPLHIVLTDLAGSNLLKAASLSENKMLQVRLSECQDPSDVHAKDIAYHANCWVINVTNVLKKVRCPTTTNIRRTAADVEFVQLLRVFLLEGNVTSMTELERCYKIIAKRNGINEDNTIARKLIKKMIQEELDDLDIEFTDAKKKNESQRLSLRAFKDAALHEVEDKDSDADNLKCLLKAAKILRKSVLACKKWEFSGSFDNINFEEILPTEVTLFFKWCLGDQYKLSSEHRKNQHMEEQLQERSRRLSQLLIYETLSDRQATNKTSLTTKHIKETPLQVAMGFIMHASLRSKFVVQILHSIGSSIDYPSILRLETQIASAVIKRMDENNGIYIPPDLIHGRRIYCAVDNIDFLENTPDGKGTLHGTIMTIYQEKYSSDAPVSLDLSNVNKTHRSLQTLPESLTNLKKYNIPKCLKPRSPVLEPNSAEEDLRELAQRVKHDDFAWILLQTVRNSTKEQCAEVAECSDIEETSSTEAIPIWSAYNSRTGQSMPQTRVCMLPLINSSSTNRSTQMEFLKKIDDLNITVQVQESDEPKTVMVTLDMGLYLPVQQLLMTRRNDFKSKILLRPGELHITMSQLKAIGSYVDGTGISDIWCESGIFEQCTIKQILEGKNVRRAMDAHIFTIVALYNFYFEVFCNSRGNFPASLHLKLKSLENALQEGNILEAHQEFLLELQTFGLLSEMASFDQEFGSKCPNFMVTRQYMKMVENMMLFTRAVRASNWDLHIAALQDFCKYYFALDQLNYARMIPWYIHEIVLLKKSDAPLWKDCQRGNWIVNKSSVPFCALGSDEALEHENRRMKVVGGLTGITQNTGALIRFFLTSPDLSRISSEAKNMLNVSSKNIPEQHHALTKSKSQRHKNNVLKIINTIKQVGNPFTIEGQRLTNLTTKFVFDEDVSKAMCEMSDIGEREYRRFVNERIIDGSKSLWDPMKKVNLTSCRTTNKKLKVKAKDTILELKDDRNLMSRLLIVSRTRPNFDLKSIICTYELSAVPRSLFAPDGQMHHCSSKSALIGLLEKLLERVETPIQNSNPKTAESQAVHVAIIDAMAEVQILDKPENIKTCVDLAEYFFTKINLKYKNYDEVHLVFDSYREDSLKSWTRRKRQGNSEAIRYRISSETIIKNIPMKKLLSHAGTKKELTLYLSQTILRMSVSMDTTFVVSCEDLVGCTNNKLDVTDLANDHEEADTKLILHCRSVAERLPSSHVHIFSQDTDVIVLALSQYNNLNKHTFFETGLGEHRRQISLENLYSRLGDSKSRALLGFHSISGADITGAFYKKGKTSHWKVFENASEDVVYGLQELGMSENIPAHVYGALEKFVCSVYAPNTTIANIEDLRWTLFSQKQLSHENLPPTRNSLIPAIQRAHFQAMVWQRCLIPKQNLPSPRNYGWILKNEEYHPICGDSSIPEEIFELTRCSCKKGRCRPPCKCVRHNLQCSEMCACGAFPESCENIKFSGIYDDSDEELE